MIGSMGYVATTVFAAAPPRSVDVRRSVIRPDEPERVGRTVVNLVPPDNLTAGVDPNRSCRPAAHFDRNATTPVTDSAHYLSLVAIALLLEATTAVRFDAIREKTMMTTATTITAAPEMVRLSRFSPAIAQPRSTATTGFTKA